MTSEEIKQNIADNLRRLRYKNGLTQEKLVEKIGEDKISLRSYKTYENELSEFVPSLEKLAIIADYYKCSLDEIVYNKDSIYSDSFTLKDNLKRLAGLIYSMVLIPQREEDINNNYYGKYYFLAYDKEITYYLDRLTLISKLKSDEYEYYDINDLDLLKYYYAEIDECKELDSDMSPTMNRLKKHMLESEIDFNEYYNNYKNRLLKRRKITSLEK